MNRLSGLFHKKIHFLWNRPESLLSENGARCEFEPRFIVAQFKIIKKTGFKSVTPRLRTKNFKGGTSPRIYQWNQSQIQNRKSSSPRIYPWGQSKI